METQIFKWDGFDISDTMCFQFYDIELVIDIGEFKVGHKFSGAYMDYEKGILQLQLPENKFKEFKLELKVVA